jgi:hypothetical protein
MSRAPIYATNASLNAEIEDEKDTTPMEEAVIRPPIRQAYNSQEEYDRAKLQGIMFAEEKKILYINHY